MNILRNKREYLEQWANSKTPSTRRQTHRFVSLGVILNEWIERAKPYNTITDVEIRKTGKEIAKILNIATFYPSTRWLERFKRKYFITEESLKNYEFGLPRKSLKIEDIIYDLKDVLEPDALIPIRGESTDPLKSSNTHIDNSTEESDFSFPVIASVTYANQEDNDDSRNGSGSENEVECVEIESDDENYKNSEDSSSRMQMGHNNCEDESEIEEETTEAEKNEEELSSYSQALEHLKCLENFAMRIEDIRAIGLIGQLGNYYKDKVEKEE